MQVNLTDWQRSVLGERIDDVLEDTEDWQLEEEDFRIAIQSWINLLVDLGLIGRAEYWIEEYKEFCELTTERQKPIVTIHIGYASHISGFELTRDQLSSISQMVDQNIINEYITGDCGRVEVNEADLFFNMMDSNPAEFKEFKDNIKVWLE